MLVLGDSVDYIAIPGTNSSPLKMDGWKLLSYWGGLFSGAILVSGRVFLVFLAMTLYLNINMLSI